MVGSVCKAEATGLAQGCEVGVIESKKTKTASKVFSLTASTN